MSEKKKALLVGGMAYNVPDELREAVDIVKHVEQSVRKLPQLPGADCVLLIAEFASHNMIEAVKSQCKVPIIYLKRGWASMKEELIARSILPPDKSVLEAPVEVEEGAVPTVSGLSEDELWKTYKTKFQEAVKGTLKPRELVSEADLLEVLSLAGAPAEDCRLILPRLQMAGFIDSPKEGLWRSLVGERGFRYEEPKILAKTAPGEIPDEEKSYQKAQGERIHRHTIERHEEEARKLSGMPRGPYRSKREIQRKLLEYEDWNPTGGEPISDNARKRLVEFAVNLGVIDDTKADLYICQDPKVVLRRRASAPPEPKTLPPLTPLQQMEGEIQEEFYKKVVVPVSRTKERWPAIVAAVGKRNKEVGIIFGNSKIQWLEDEKILIVLIPNEYSMYRMKLESTAVSGHLTQVAREELGMGTAVRIIVENTKR